MITYLAGWARKKDTLFASVVQAAGGGRRLAIIGLSFRGFPESTERAQAALAVAKRQPKGAIGRWLKFQLIRAQYNWSRRYFSAHPAQIAMCWNGLTGSRRAFMEGARDAGAKRLFVELAPFPDRCTLDPEGVNALNCLPRNPDRYRDWSAKDAGRQEDGWRQLGENLTARVSRRKDVGQSGSEDLADAGNFLFCPLQVPNDSQITLFADWVGSVPGMLEALAKASQALPEGWHIRIKEHPSAKSSLADVLERAVAKADGRLVVDNQTDTFAQVAASEGIITINSSVGLQAFFYDRPVITLGQAFFALPGLVHPANSAEELHSLLRNPAALTFDPDLRAAFMNYLDQVYYPKTQTDTDGNVTVDPAAVRRLIQDAAPAN